MKEFEIKVAEKMIGILDLTDFSPALNIDALCEKAISPYGTVAGVCVLPQYVKELNARIGSKVKIVTVANFPSGDLNLYRTCSEVKKAIDDGADEIDVVFPYFAFLNHQARLCEDFLRGVREAAGDKTLKVILETGALKSQGYVKRASEMAIRIGADFIKTSTGRISKGASVESVGTMLAAIRSAEAEARTGIKISGGISTFSQALIYLELVIATMGSEWGTPDHFRFGASSLFESLISKIEQD
ncbi:deoxyribose-phosphate aldolase [Ignatzschineria sp. RMDPL8A]|uniref:deoxyribose-phosphate aldolase n=1 Tax=Ignatzschineria sp. RMDPL8A TaxID=2999236 RepID=UPI0016925B36|nr:deoxyribose-phosphate aldolase [Ignatzschineria sp. RMDPL8A]MDG9728823.1 deoxyribose-phosphate aldolase [Ignatzschineria sp. RMDPL8A]NLD09305.1 deoxyribose-phosphate aldolase [Xanthomonadaceae bacterium]